MAKKKHDPQAKAKRQKVIAAVGGVILLGLLAFQLPRTMKLLHQSNATASSAPATAPATPGVAPAVGVSVTGTAAATSADGITDPGSAVTPQSGQLLAFSRFHTKDPFSQQINLDCVAGQSTSADCGSGSGSGSGSGTGTGSGSGSGSGGGTGSTGPGGVAQPPAKPSTALISVNGATETVSVGAQFPAASPVFVLVSLTKTSAKIGIAGGSLQGGGTAILKKGKTLTLMNTSDGTRYVLRLVSVA
jgi:hypothetical protein